MDPTGVNQTILNPVYPDLDPAKVLIAVKLRATQLEHKLEHETRSNSQLTQQIQSLSIQLTQHIQALTAQVPGTSTATDRPTVSSAKVDALLLIQRQDSTIALASFLVPHAQLTRKLASLTTRLAHLKRVHADVARAAAAAEQAHRDARFDTLIEQRYSKSKTYLSSIAAAAKVPGATKAKTRELEKELDSVEREKKAEWDVVWAIKSQARAVANNNEQLEKDITGSTQDLAWIHEKLDPNWRKSLIDLRVRITHKGEDIRHSSAERDKLSKELSKARNAASQCAHHLGTVVDQADEIERRCERLQAVGEDDRDGTATPTPVQRLLRALAHAAARIRSLEDQLAPVTAQHAALTAANHQLAEEHPELIRKKLSAVLANVVRLSAEAGERRKGLIREGNAHMRASDSLRAKESVFAPVLVAVAIGAARREGVGLEEVCGQLEGRVRVVQEEERKRVAAVAARKEATRAKAARQASAVRRLSLSTVPTSTSGARGAFELEQASKTIEILSTAIKATNKRVDDLRESNAEMMTRLAGR